MRATSSIPFYQSSEAKQNPSAHNRASIRLDIPQEENLGPGPGKNTGSFHIDSNENLSGFSRLKIDQNQENSGSGQSSNRVDSVQKSVITLIKLEEDMEDQVVQRLNDIIKQRQTRQPKLFNSGETGKEIGQVVSPTVQRNMNLVKRISKFRDIKGIKQNSKEIRFEDRLKEFKHVKTFVKIPDVFSNLSNSVKALPDSQLKQSSFRSKGTLGSPNKFARNVSGSFENKLSFETNFSTDSDEESTEISPKKESLKLESKLQPIDEDEIEINEMEEMYNQLKENIIKQIGLEAFEQIEAELLDPKKQREVKSRTKMQILKLRAMKEKLRNSDIFHSLIHHLNSQRLNKVPEEEDGNCSLLSFYRDIDRKLKEGMESPHIIRGDDLDKDQEECEVESHNFKQNFQLRALLLRQEIARNEELSKKNKVPEAVMNLVEHVDDDRQVRVAGVLNAYKERSNKVIKLLKKKTMTIGQKDVKTDRAAIEDTKVRLNKIFDPIENPSSRTNRTQMKIKIKTDSKPYLPILTRDESSAQTKTRSNWKKKAQNCFEYEESLALHPPKLRLTESSPSPSKFQQNILENKKRFNRINGQKLLRSSQGSYRENKNSPCEYGIYSGVDLSLKRSPSKISERFQIENIRKKRGCFSFEKSLDGIKGMLNDLSQTNREFGSELENSKTTMKTYYDTKINSIQKEEIPESLRLQIQTEDAKGRAALIMKLTKKVLRDAYDY